MNSIQQELSKTTYPGRGILIGKSEDGKKAVIAYFIMGRSENSRNRVFVEENGVIKTQPFDPSKMKDPSLIIYSPLRVYQNATIVTNGDQTDTIYQAIQQKDRQLYDEISYPQTLRAFEKALRMRSFEPDAPNYTPRISGLAYLKPKKKKKKKEEMSFHFALSIVKSNHGDPSSCVRFTYTYDQPLAGEGYLIHTYNGDGDPLPSFTGEPACVALGNDIWTITEEIWNALDPDNRISLLVRTIDLREGKVENRILNANT